MLLFCLEVVVPTFLKLKGLYLIKAITFLTCNDNMKIVLNSLTI